MTEEEKKALEEAAGNRNTDQENGEKATPPAGEDNTKGNPEGDDKRPADQSGELDDEGTDPKDQATKAPKAKDVKDPSLEEEKDDEEEDEDGDEEEKDLDETAKFKLSDELGNILESEGLSDDFKSKAVTIFEAAVNVASKKHVSALDEAFEKKLDEAVEAKNQELEENFSKYMDYVAQEWADENKVAIKEGLRTEMAEAFMVGLMDLLEKHYVHVPADKTDLYEQSKETIAELEKSLDEEIEKNIELSKELDEAKKDLAVEKFVSDLTDTKAEKIRELAEDIEYEGEDDFTSKLEALKENYTAKPKRTSMVSEDVEGDTTEELNQDDVPAHMKPYVSALSAF